MKLLAVGSVLLLMIAQALFWTCVVIGITLTAIVGLSLAPARELATLPLGSLVVGTLLSIHTIGRLMRRRGRRAGFVLGAVIGSAGGVVAAFGVRSGNFAAFCLGTGLIGVYQASAGFYRYAAAEVVDAKERGKASAYVLGGGLVAALIGPWLALGAADVFATKYLGTYLLISLLAAASALVLTRIAEHPVQIPPAAAPSQLRKVRFSSQVRWAVFVAATGHGIMILAMNATPLAMQICGHPATLAAQVIQWHVLGMFLPSFFAGPLTDRLGARAVALLGLAVLCVSGAVAASGLAFYNFLASSLMLGLGWNLMIVAGTAMLANACAGKEASREQAFMELANGATAVVMSSAAGALVPTLEWRPINALIVPATIAIAAGIWRYQSKRDGKAKVQAAA